MTNVLLPRTAAGIVSGTPIEAQVAVGVSAELAMHHLHTHPCNTHDRWDRALYVCEECASTGVTVRVYECPICGEPLAAVADLVCEHFDELLEELGDQASVAVARRVAVRQ